MYIKCLIVDDEPLAIKVIKSHVSRFDFIEVVGECKNAMQAIDYLRNQTINLIFLDINMPKVTGLDFLRSLPHPPSIIITTAYRDYAIEGYELDVLDYLLKPISFERFLKAINKYCERQEKTSFSKNDGWISNQIPPFIYVQDGRIINKIFLDRILYLEGYGEYVKIHTSEKTYLSRKTLLEYENHLSKNLFLRVHKSYLIALPQIAGFTSSTVIIKGKEIPIGRTYRENVMSILDYRKDNLDISDQIR